MNENPETKAAVYEEKEPNLKSGMAVLLGNSLAMLVAVGVFVLGVVIASGTIGGQTTAETALAVILIIISLLYACVLGPVIYNGLKILRPNEARVFTLFGKYHGTIKREGFFFINPLATPMQPQKISLKVVTHNNETQKINDQLGNPIIIGIVVVWKVVNPTKAVFNVDNFWNFLSMQCDSALRDIVRLYPYDTFGDDNEKTLRGSSQEIAIKLRDEIQTKTEIAGLEIIETRITHLSYAPEIAAVMLQRQQASAIIDARQMIVDGAVGMVEMALTKLSAKNIVALDDERKAAMVSNLLVVLCGNKDAQPVVNSGSLY